VLEDVSEEEFRVFMALLVQLSIFKNSKTELLEILAHQADLKSQFKESNTYQL
jgi:hypothetical protein